MFDWVLKHSYEITALSSLAMAAATIIMAVATTIYAFIARKTLKQIQCTAASAVRPVLTLIEESYTRKWPDPISIVVKNMGFGLARDLTLDKNQTPNGVDIDITNRNLGVGDSLYLKISPRPRTYEAISSTPIYSDEINNYRGGFRILVFYRDIYGGVYKLHVDFYIEAGRLEFH